MRWLTLHSDVKLLRTLYDLEAGARPSEVMCEHYWKLHNDNEGVKKLFASSYLQ